MCLYWNSIVLQQPKNKVFSQISKVWKTTKITLKPWNIEAEIDLIELKKKSLGNSVENMKLEKQGILEPVTGCSKGRTSIF